MPEHARRPQLAGDELSPGRAAARDSVEPVMYGDVGTQDRIQGGSGWNRSRPPLFRDARQRRQPGKARCLRRENDEGGLEP